MTPILIANLSKSECIFSETASAAAKVVGVLKGLTENQLKLFNELKSLPELPLGTVSNPRFITMNKVKFVVSINTTTNKIEKQKQIFSIVTGQGKGGTIQEAVIKDISPSAAGYVWASNKVVFYFE